MAGNSKRRRRGYGPAPLARSLPGLIGYAFRRRGFAETSIITEWPAIVGAELARDTSPQKLVFPRGSATGATLHIRVSGAFATELQHLSPLVIERINGYFGFAAVARLALTQGGPVAAPPRQPGPRRQAVPEGWVARRIGNVRDGRLRDALARLGATVFDAGRGGGDNNASGGA